MKLPEIPKRIAKTISKNEGKLIKNHANVENIDLNKEDLSRKSTLNSNNQLAGNAEEQNNASPLNLTNAKFKVQKNASPNNSLKSMIKKNRRGSTEIIVTPKQVKFKDNLHNEKLVQVIPVESYKHFYLNDEVNDVDSCCCMIQ